MSNSILPFYVDSIDGPCPNLYTCLGVSVILVTERVPLWIRNTHYSIYLLPIGVSYQLYIDLIYFISGVISLRCLKPAK